MLREKLKKTYDVRAMLSTSFERCAVIFVATLLFAEMLRLGLPADLRRNESGDYIDFYEPVARNLADGRGLVTAAGAPAVRYPPGYPILLAFVFRAARLSGIADVIAVRWFHLLCAGIASVLVFLAAGRIWDAQRALLAAIAWTTYPPALWLTRQPSSELPLFVAFFGGLFLFLEALRSRRRRPALFFLTGIAAGLAALIRPMCGGVGVLLAILIWIAKPWSPARHRLVWSLALILGHAAVIVPWEAVLRSRTGEWLPLSSGGPASLLDGWTYAIHPGKIWLQDRTAPAGTAGLMADLLARRDAFGSLGGGISLIVAEGLMHPGAAARLLVLKMARSWYATDSRRFETATLAIQSLYGGLIVLATLRAWNRGGARRRMACGIWLVVIYFWSLTILFLSIARYMIPAIGLAFLLLPHLAPCRSRIPSRASP